jgi:AcrR family transcriptional regulator
MSDADERPEGQRESTRTLLLDAARRLFAEQGVEATTIRQIADAAGVTERTFYRYFEGKEGLVGADALSWIDILNRAIRDRPAEEAPYLAVRRAMAGVAGRLRELGGASLWMFVDRPRDRPLLPRATTRPLQRLETSITDALLARDPEALRDPAGAGTDPRFGAELLARLAGGALRSAVTRHRRLEADEEGSSPGVAALLDQAFSLIATLAAAGRTERS